MEHRNLFATGRSIPASLPIDSFFGLSEEEIETHLAIKEYNGFTLTGAVAPSYDLKVKPRLGFRCEYYEKSSPPTPVVIISASKEILFALFMELVALVGEKSADVVLETSHFRTSKNLANGHTDFLRKGIDLCVFESILWDFEEFLLEDGCTGVAIVDSRNSIELQFDEHKLLVIYNWPVAKDNLLAVLGRYGIQEDASMKFICEAEHIHLTTDRLWDKFNELAIRLGAEEK